jgi:hypothetical protein
MVTVLTSEMRRALCVSGLHTPLGAWLGPSVGEVPRTTAKALAARGLVTIEGSRVTLTDAGKVAAAEVAEAHRKLLHD